MLPINVAFQRYCDLQDNNLSLYYRMDTIEHSLSYASKTVGHVARTEKNLLEGISFHDYDERKILAKSLPLIDFTLRASEIELVSDPYAFELLKELISFVEYQTISPSFKRKFRKVSQERRLEWIIKLLIDYHSEHECSLYLSLAIKLSLRTLKLCYKNVSNRMGSVNGF